MVVRGQRNWARTVGSRSGSQTGRDPDGIPALEAANNGSSAVEPANEITTVELLPLGPGPQ